MTHLAQVAGRAAHQFAGFAADFAAPLVEYRQIHPETGAPQTAHTTFEVPLIYVGGHPARLLDDGSLCDIAPTLLTMMDQPIPEEMTGRVLIERD